MSDKGMKLCPKCGELLYFNSHFGGYVCGECGWACVWRGKRDGLYDDFEPVKRATWLEADDGDGLVCSNCSMDYCTMIVDVYSFKRCPNCGAYMEMGGSNEKQAIRPE